MGPQFRPLCLALVCAALWLAGGAGAPSPARADSETLAVFVGEDLSVLSLASRRPESPDRAPAVARVVTAQEIRARGLRTLADVLMLEPGFYVRPGERGSTPYLRGVGQGILLLYDGVPLGSNVTKSVHPLDEDLSLAGVQRIEIIRGPGSVLWGPDAYAGIVNIVPYSGKDRPGARVQAWAGTDHRRGTALSWGWAGRDLAGFLSVSAEKNRYWTDTFALPGDGPGGAAETGRLDDASFADAVATLEVGDWLRMTARWSDHTNRFVLQGPESLRWEGRRRAPARFIKASATRRLGISDVTVNAFYENLPLEVTDVDVTRSQENHIWSAEVLWYRPLDPAGGLTLGAGYRNNRAEDAVVRDGFLPDFLKPSSSVFVPQVTQASFDDRLLSAFAQVRRRWGPVDLWAGLRLDDSDAYRSTISVTAGLQWEPAEAWRIKASYGSAYRNPYAAQLYGDRSFDPEGIRTGAVQVAWTPSPADQVQLTAFYSRLTDHLAEDPYGGLSMPETERLWGLELDGRWRLHPRLDLRASLTVLGDDADPERYRSLAALFVRPDGTVEPVFEEWEKPFDLGPDVMASAGGTWTLGPGCTLSVDALWTSELPYAYDKGRFVGTYDGERFLRAALQWRDVPVAGSTLRLAASNLLDQGGRVPGIYGPADRPPLRVWVEWSYRW
ncbi:MAG: TonB-dependent receptor [Desulfacinum sp.]|nr:TonB-dependent receptor [Desulfacinum sp.]